MYEWNYAASYFFIPLLVMDTENSKRLVKALTSVVQMKEKICTQLHLSNSTYNFHISLFLATDAHAGTHVWMYT